MKKIWQICGHVCFWLSWPALRLWVGGSRRTRAVITTPDGSVLMLKGWLGSGHWTLPGGGVHRHEAAQAAVLREIYEETGIRLDKIRLRLSGELAVREYGIPYRAVIFHAAMNDKPALKPPRIEIVEAAWLQPSELHHLSPVTRRVLHG